MLNPSGFLNHSFSFCYSYLTPMELKEKLQLKELLSVIYKLLALLNERPVPGEQKENPF